MNTYSRARWIVVDDDSRIAQVAALVLNDLDAAEVIVCGSGREALAVYEEDPDSVRLVLTDWDMPEMDGLELSRRLHERSPDLQIVMMTGRHWNLNQAAASRAGICAVLAKPFFIADLEATIRDVLDLHDQQEVPIDVMLFAAA